MPEEIIGSRVRSLETNEERLSGNGAPALTAADGTYYWDYTNTELYINDSGVGTFGNSWQHIGGGGVAVPHQLLDNPWHTDTATQAPTRGSLIYGDATPAWNELVLGGAAGSFVRRDATDVMWSTLVLPNAAATGDILYATGANTIGNLADVAVGQALVSGGVGVAPAYSASPTLTGLTLSGLTPSTAIYSNAGRSITSLANAAGYMYNNGAGVLSWAATAAPTAHNLLSASHGDTVVQGATRGSLIYGNATPAWDELVHPAAANRILQSTATDTQWSAQTLTLTTALTNQGAAGVLNWGGAFTLTVPATGTAALGTGAANRIAYWSTANTLTSDAGLTYAAGTDSLTAGDYYATDGGQYGISGNELLTVNAAGTFAFSGISGVSVEDGDWIGAGSGCAWLYDSGNGDISTTVNVGIGTIIPDRLLHAESSDAVTAAITYAQRLSHTTSGTAAALFGVGQEFELEDSAGNMQVAAEVSALWGAASTANESPLLRFTTYPQGAIGPGYMALWSYRAVAGASRIAIPAGAGDVSSYFWCRYLVDESAGGQATGTVEGLAPGAAQDIYNDGTDVLELDVAGGGQVSVVRTSATAVTFDVTLFMIWM